jgi:hypothetical protein
MNDQEKISSLETQVKHLQEIIENLELQLATVYHEKSVYTSDDLVTPYQTKLITLQEA